MEVASVKYFDPSEKEQCSDLKKAVRNQKVRKNREIKVKKFRIIPVMLLTILHHSVDGIISNSMWQNIVKPKTPFSTRQYNQTVKHSKLQSCLIHGFHSTFLHKNETSINSFF